MKRGRYWELRLAKWVKGEHVGDRVNEYDIETTNCLYEVKTANVFNIANNVNRPQFGRFIIFTDNHIKLYLKSLQKRKKAQYIFVVKQGKQGIIYFLPWDKILIDNSRDQHTIKITEIMKHGKKEKDS